MLFMIRSLMQKKDMFWLRLFLCSFAIGSVFFGIPEATAQSSPEEGFAKVVEDPEAGTVVLQVASRRFERPGQTGPVVTTYSMLHIAD